MIPERIKKLAYKAALKSTHRFRLGAVIFDKKKRVLSFGWNKATKTHPRSSTPYKTIHAELCAVIGLSREQLRNSNIYVYRIKKNGESGLAKPCSFCHNMLNEVGVKGIYYSQ